MLHTLLWPPSTGIMIQERSWRMEEALGFLEAMAKDILCSTIYSKTARTSGNGFAGLHELSRIP